MWLFTESAALMLNPSQAPSPVLILSGMDIMEGDIMVDTIQDLDTTDEDTTLDKRTNPRKKSTLPFPGLALLKFEMDTGFILWNM